MNMFETNIIDIIGIILETQHRWSSYDMVSGSYDLKTWTPREWTRMMRNLPRSLIVVHMSSGFVAKPRGIWWYMMLRWTWSLWRRGRSVKFFAIEDPTWRINDWFGSSTRLDHVVYLGYLGILLWILVLNHSNLEDIHFYCSPLVN